MYSWYKLRKFYPPGVDPSEYWDRKYETDGVQRDDPEEYRKQLFYPLLTKYLEKGKKYLDAGCGLGGWLAFLRARGYDIVGIDRSRKAIALAKRMDPTLPAKVGDVCHLPFPDASFDGYIAIGTWEYAEDATEDVVKEAVRVLGPGGVLIIEVPYANPVRRWTYLPLKTLEFLLRAYILRQKPTFSHFLFRKGDIRVLLEDLGLSLLEINPHDLPEPKSHYGLWIDWPFFRGKRPYELNSLGLLVKRVMNAVSPWMIATGMFFVAKKK
jgi:SAM-dependent methyltransferase